MSYVKKLNHVIVFMLMFLVTATWLLARPALAAGTVNITFQMMGHGQQVEDIRVNQGETAQQPENPQEEQYIFGGWYLDESCNIPFSFHSPVQEDVTLYAEWIPFMNETSWYTISFYTGDDATQVSPQEVKSGLLAMQPASIPEKEGYEFTGWFMDTACEQPFVFESTPILSDITVCAGWEKVSAEETVESIDPQIMLANAEKEREQSQKRLEMSEKRLNASETAIEVPMNFTTPQEVIPVQELLNAINEESVSNCTDLDYWYHGIDEEKYSARLVQATTEIPFVGEGYCALWVAYVYQEAGLGFLSGNACDFWASYGVSDNLNDIREGMIIAVPKSPTSLTGWEYGHAGILVQNASYQEPDNPEEKPAQYVSSGNVSYEKDQNGNEKWLVAENTTSVQYTPLSKWISTYNVTNQVKWGWGHYYTTLRVNWEGDIPKYVDFVSYEAPKLVYSSGGSSSGPVEEQNAQQETEEQTTEEETTTQPETEEATSQPETQPETTATQPETTQPETTTQAPEETAKQPEPETSAPQETQPATQPTETVAQEEPTASQEPETTEPQTVSEPQTTAPETTVPETTQPTEVPQETQPETQAPQPETTTEPEIVETQPQTEVVPQPETPTQPVETPQETPIQETPSETTEPQDVPQDPTPVQPEIPSEPEAPVEIVSEPAVETPAPTTEAENTYSTEELLQSVDALLEEYGVTP